MYTNLQPLNVCLSFQGTVNIIDKLSEDHDIEVQMWSDELLKEMKRPTQDVSAQAIALCLWEWIHNTYR